MTIDYALFSSSIRRVASFRKTEMKSLVSLDCTRCFGRIADRCSRTLGWNGLITRSE